MSRPIGCWLRYVTAKWKPSIGNHFDQSLSFSQKNGNSLTWVLVALTVCFTYPILFPVTSAKIKPIP